MNFLRVSAFTVVFLISAQAGAQYNCYIYGMHDYNSEIASLLTYSGEPRGWVLILQSLEGYYGGTNSAVIDAANDGLGVLVRLHWGYGTSGTLPPVAQYPTFASRAANFIANHIDHCKFYHIGNEPNFCAEWPAGGLGDGRCEPDCTDIREQITAARYVDCFEQVYNALSPALQAEAKLLVAPTGTWAGEFTCDPHGFETFDFVCYAEEIYAGIPDYMIGGFSLHPKTHDHQVWQITDNSLSSTPAFGCAHNEYVHWYFRVYQDMMDDIPSNLRHLPVFFTELNPHESGWSDVNNTYVQAAYNEINAWNIAHPNRLITAMMLYRWDDGDDRWDIHSRNQVKADLQAAVANGQTSNGCAVVTTPTSTPTGPTPTSTPPTGEPGPNLLANWSFEGSGTGSLDGWTAQPNFIVDNTFPSGSPPPDGSHWAGHSFTGGSPSIREAYQTVIVEPGHRHLLRVQVMGGGVPGGISTGRLQWYNGNYPGFGYGQNVTVFSWPADEPAMIWKEMSGIVTPTSNRLTFVLQVEIEGNWIGAGINFDACELRDVEPVSSPTPTPTNTPTLTPTDTHTPAPTGTPTRTATKVPTPTETPDPSGTTGAASWRAY